MDISHALIAAVTAILTAGMSLYGTSRTTKRQQKLDESTNNTVQVQTIFDGYSRIVADLHAEVQRLHGLINELHLEQEACEKRNDLLENEIAELQARICKLEEGTNARK